jgi:hypothetical protein
MGSTPDEIRGRVSGLVGAREDRKNPLHGKESGLVPALPIRLDSQDVSQNA